VYFVYTYVSFNQEIELYSDPLCRRSVQNRVRVGVTFSLLRWRLLPDHERSL
jgi:hypothetical protein